VVSPTETPERGIKLEEGSTGELDMKRNGIGTQAASQSEPGERLTKLL